MNFKHFFIISILLLLSTLGAKAQFMFAEGTPIVMANDTEIKVEKLIVGDVVLAFNEKDKVYEEKKVKSITSTMLNRFASITLETGKQITLTLDSPIYAEKGWISLSPEQTMANDKYKKVGTCTQDDFVLFYNVESSDYIEIHTIRGVLEAKKAYVIELEGDGAIVANGFLVGQN
ncbi:Hint domain-containing protein [Dysgonomonas sp. Marseille-P4361]|uniref:Hint domain-containing protein n=1 Tax=Dysgonomonas sp. Marseille-P4361 TaxID=2161820 RepID=UPI000D551D75|nr:Hint domain-containing protein [Dysgonomonas sp. Marseille-P4361]